MKKFLIFLLCLISIFFSLAFPTTTAGGVKCGITIALYSAIPSLMVFILIINIMLKYNLCNYISVIVYPLFSRLFRISYNGCFVVICGFSCGYPIGIKTIFELLDNHMISKNEAKYLMTFCNNTSISFIINYIGALCLNGKVPSGLLVFYIFSPAFITGIVNAQIFMREKSPHIHGNNVMHINPVKSTVSSLTSISFYVIVFSVISAWFCGLCHFHPVYQTILTGMLEITAGIKGISALTDITIQTKLFFICLFTIWGGVSISAQSLSFIHDKKFIKYYLFGKLEAIFIFFIEFFIIRLF